MRSLSARPRLVFAAIVTAVTMAVVSVQQVPARAARLAQPPADTATPTRTNTPTPSQTATRTATASPTPGVTVLPPPTCAPIPDDLVAWWKFDESSSVTAHDVGPHQLDGTVVGNSPTWRPTSGHVQGAVEFMRLPIGEHISVPHTPELDLGAGTREFSIDAWLMFPNDSVISNYLLGKRRFGGGQQGYNLQVRNRRIELDLFSDVGGLDYHYYFTGPVFSTGIWQHMAVTVKRDGGLQGIQFYINGIEVPEITLNGDAGRTAHLDITNTEPFTVGGNITTEGFRGFVDELHVYRRALAAAEVRAIYDAGATGMCLPAPTDDPCVDICELDARVIALESCPSACALDVRLQAAEATVPILQAQVATLQGQVSALEAKVAALGGVEARLAALEDKLQHVSRAGNDLTISGANLHVVNGTGATDGGPNALGNVIVGYNEARPGGGDPRTGSHMVVVGRGNSYSAFGGIVAGENNTARGRFATVGGGNGNLASGDYSSVSGGQGNISGAYAASVSGGQSNTASGVAASVSGGQSNTATRSYASASGGRNNTASGNYASVSGGQNNTASGSFASVSGGSYNTAAGTSYASVSGGTNNTATGSAASVCGGIVNTASGRYASVTGGSSNTAAAEASTVGGGDRNTANGVRSTVGGGANRSTTAGQTNAWRGGNLIQPN